MKTKNRIAVSVFITAFAFGLNITGVLPILGILNEKYQQYGTGMVQQLQTMPYLMLIVGSLLVGWLTTRISKKKIVITGLIVIGICGMLPFFLENFLILVMTRLLIGFGFGIVGPMNTAIITEFFPPEERASYMGLHVVGMGIGKGKQLADTGKKVCVVGGGPAGLTAAYYLRKQGHDVTLKEALPTVGGMMAYGIPSYRLPREIIADEADVIVEQGVKIEVNTKVEKPAELLNEYDAVLMTIGGHKGVRLPMEGSELPGTILNADFLRNASMGNETGIGKRIIVLGGGNVAFDCARTAKRLGAEEIHLACLEARDAMTADEEEITQAQEEGIFVHPAQTFERITGTDAVTGVDFMNVKSFTFDENRRAIIEKEEGSEHHIDADTVIFAVGQRPDITEEAGLELGRGNSIVVKNMDNDKTTSVEGIFAAGDAIYGTKSVIMAIESGRQAASQIDKYLGGDGDISEVLAPVQKADPYIGQCPGFGYQERKHTQVDAPEKRSGNFNLFDHGICDSDICAEAGRCLQCDLRLQISRPSLWGDFVEQKEAE